MASRQFGLFFRRLAVDRSDWKSSAFVEPKQDVVHHTYISGMYMIQNPSKTHWMIHSKWIETSSCVAKKAVELAVNQFSLHFKNRWVDHNTFFWYENMKGTWTWRSPSEADDVKMLLVAWHPGSHVPNIQTQRRIQGGVLYLSAFFVKRHIRYIYIYTLIEIDLINRNYEFIIKYFSNLELILDISFVIIHYISISSWVV